MSDSKSKQSTIRNKKALIISGVAVAVAAIGATFAYYADTMSFANVFHPTSDQSEFSETFDSPNNWQPCEDIDKVATATNHNDNPRYVRMKINEYWRTKNSTTPADDHTTTDLPLTWTDGSTQKKYAIIKTQNESKWTYNSTDGWYYYADALGKDESTLSYLKSVMMNCDASFIESIQYSQDGKTGTTVPNEYADATYHLYVTFQMSNEPLL